MIAGFSMGTRAWKRTGTMLLSAGVVSRAAQSLTLVNGLGRAGHLYIASMVFKVGST